MGIVSQPLVNTTHTPLDVPSTHIQLLAAFVDNRLHPNNIFRPKVCKNNVYCSYWSQFLWFQLLLGELLSLEFTHIHYLSTRFMQKAYHTIYLLSVHFDPTRATNAANTSFVNLLVSILCSVEWLIATVHDYIGIWKLWRHLAPIEFEYTSSL